LTLLHEATGRRSPTPSVDEIEREVVRAAQRLVGAGGVARGRADLLRVGDASGTADIPAARLARTALAEGRALAAGQVAAAPVFVQDEAYGAVVVTVEGGRSFSEEDLHRLEAVAGLAEVAIGSGRRVEAVRRERERVAALDEARARLLRLASHELRGPLTVVRGYVSMLREGTLPGGAEQLQEVYAILDGKAGQMELLVSQMLEAARLEDGRLCADLRRIDVREPVREAFEGARVLARPVHALSLEEPARPVEVMADAARVTTIVANLLDNAVKYSPRGGPVRCAVRVEGGRAIVEVSDRGLGVAAADQPTLFTRFGRVETPATRHIPGTGLGLHLSRELAQLQRGTLTATSAAGEGSTFSLTLPLAS